MLHVDVNTKLKLAKLMMLEQLAKLIKPEQLVKLVLIADY